VYVGVTKCGVTAYTHRDLQVLGSDPCRYGLGMVKKCWLVCEAMVAVWIYGERIIQRMCETPHRHPFRLIPTASGEYESIDRTNP
jgi:hypothetical protein